MKDTKEEWKTEESLQKKHSKKEQKHILIRRKGKNERMRERRKEGRKRKIEKRKKNKNRRESK